MAYEVASVRLYGRPAGVLRAAPDGKLEFEYTRSWVKDHLAGVTTAHALSFSLPVRSEVYGWEATGPFFGGLLPENVNNRRALARRLRIDSRDDFRLLIALGRDCPGALSIVDPEEPLAPETRIRPEYSVLDETELAELIEDLPARPLFIDADGDLRLSLAGVHDKAALLRVGGKAAIPTGKTPTTHILKVDINGLPDSARVENYCLKLAAELGIDVPKSDILSARGIPYLLLSRYDRVIGRDESGQYLRRLHQEDFCQALGRFPAQKYEKNGGLSWTECFDLARRLADPGKSVDALLRRVIFQYLINNPDAHAKNYALVYGGSGVQISKLYDVNNAAAFRSRFKETRPRMAMSIGGELDPTKLTLRHWAQFAEEVRLRPEPVMEALSNMAIEMPEKALALRESFKGTLADSDLLDLVVEDVGLRCSFVRSILNRAEVSGRPRPDSDFITPGGNY